MLSRKPHSSVKPRTEQGIAQPGGYLKIFLGKRKGGSR
jgi:hypothetical protein